MKVEIIRKPKNLGEEKQIETIEFDGNIVFPYYLTLLSMEHHPDRLVFRTLGDYTTKFSADGEKLWIMGDRTSDENTVNRYEAELEEMR